LCNIGIRKNNSSPPYHIFVCAGDYFVFDTFACHFYKIANVTVIANKAAKISSAAVDAIAQCCEGKN